MTVKAPLKIIKQEVEPRVFAVSLSSVNQGQIPNHGVLYMGLHYSNEEALEKAEEMGRAQSMQIFGQSIGFNIRIHESMTVRDILDKTTIKEAPVEEVPSVLGDYSDSKLKNQIMKQIIENADRSLFKKLGWAFTANEAKFLGDNLKSAYAKKDTKKSKD